MKVSDLTEQLSLVTNEDDAQYALEDLMSKWKDEGVGFEAVDPILSFMEAHSAWDLGMPGALTHFLEKFYKNGLEDKVISSIERKPCTHTIVMLTRIINAEKDLRKKEYYLSCFQNAKLSRNIDEATISIISAIEEEWKKTKSNKD